MSWSEPKHTLPEFGVSGPRGRPLRHSGNVDAIYSRRHLDVEQFHTALDSFSVGISTDHSVTANNALMIYRI